MTKILVVDDAAFIRMRCTKLLTQNGYEVVEAATGVQAVEEFKSANPDVVLLDITMPDKILGFADALHTFSRKSGSNRI